MVTKLADSGLLVFLKGFDTSVFSTCRISAGEVGQSNLKVLYGFFFTFKFINKHLYLKNKNETECFR